MRKPWLACCILLAVAALGAWTGLAGPFEARAAEVPSPFDARHPEPAPGEALRFHDVPEYGLLFVSILDQDLEPGHRLLYEQDLFGALEHFQHAAASSPWQRLSRAIGLGRACFELGRWFEHAARLSAETNLVYAQWHGERRPARRIEPLSQLEQSVLRRSAWFLGRAAVAAEAPGASEPGGLAVHGLLEKLVAQGPWTALQSFRSVKRARADGQPRLEDPYLLAAASRAFHEAARLSFREALAISAGLADRLDLAVREGLQRDLARACLALGDRACVAELGPGGRGTELALVVTASERRAQSLPLTLDALMEEQLSFHARIRAAELAEDSPLEKRIGALDRAIEQGKHRHKYDTELWPDAYQEALAIQAALLARQADQATKLEDRDALLSEASDRLHEAPYEFDARKQNPLYMLESVLVGIKRRGCSDLAQASGTLQEQRRRHPALGTILWALQEIYANDCGEGWTCILGN